MSDPSPRSGIALTCFVEGRALVVALRTSGLMILLGYLPRLCSLSPMESSLVLILAFSHGLLAWDIIRNGVGPNVVTPLVFSLYSCGV